MAEKIEQTKAREASQLRMSSRWFHGWWIALAALLVISLSHGVRLSFGVYLVPLSEEFGWTRAATAGIFSFYMVVYGLASPFVGILADRRGPRLLCVIGVLFLGTGLIVASFTSVAWYLFLSYSVLTALGAAFIFVPSLGAVPKFFSKRRGLALGIAMAGTGLGPFISNPVSQLLITSYGWRYAFLITGLVVIAIGVPVAAIVMRRVPEATGLPSDGKAGRGSQNSPATAAPGPGSPHGKDYTISQALKTPVLWLTAPCFMVSGLLLMSMTAHLVAHAVDSGIEKMVAAAAVGILGLI